MSKNYSVLDTNAFILLMIPPYVTFEYRDSEISARPKSKDNNKDNILNLHNFFGNNQDNLNYVITPTVEEELNREKGGRESGIIYEELERNGFNGYVAEKIIGERKSELHEKIETIQDLYAPTAKKDKVKYIRNGFIDSTKNLMDEEREYFKKSEKNMLPCENDLSIVAETLHLGPKENNVSILTFDGHFCLPTYKNFLKDEYDLEILCMEDLKDL
ncbi:MAG: hypothetical protein ABEK36_00870 [Candidatus Aenigmatarchaeota archaeon]